MSLGTWRIVILAGLVVSGGIILSNGFAGGGGTEPTPTTGSEPTGSTGPPVTESPAPPPVTGEVEGVTFAVLNGTQETGLAAEVAIALEDAGYTSAQDAADAPTTGVRKTTVYFRPGDDPAQSRANAELLIGTNLAGTRVDLSSARIRRLSSEFADIVPPSTQIVIVLGQAEVP